MARKNKAERELHWQEIVKRQADSGLPVRRFCASEGISEPSFYAWRRKLQTRKNDTAPRKVRRHDEGGSENGRLFVPLQLVEGGSTLTIVHPLGYRIQVSGEVSPATLRQVIETLDERGVQ
jgi:hypothetical protein